MLNTEKQVQKQKKKNIPLVTKDSRINKTLTSTTHAESSSDQNVASHTISSNIPHLCVESSCQVGTSDRPSRPIPYSSLFLCRNIPSLRQEDTIRNLNIRAPNPALFPSRQLGRVIIVPIFRLRNIKTLRSVSFLEANFNGFYEMKRQDTNNLPSNVVPRKTLYDHFRFAKFLMLQHKF